MLASVSTLDLLLYYGNIALVLRMYILSLFNITKTDQRSNDQFPLFGTLSFEQPRGLTADVLNASKGLVKFSQYRTKFYFYYNFSSEFHRLPAAKSMKKIENKAMNRSTR